MLELQDIPTQTQARIDEVLDKMVLYDREQGMPLSLRVEDTHFRFAALISGDYVDDALEAAMTLCGLCTDERTFRQHCERMIALVDALLKDKSLSSDSAEAVKARLRGLYFDGAMGSVLTA
jgi:hypothetical protein